MSQGKCNILAECKIFATGSTFIKYERGTATTTYSSLPPQQAAQLARNFLRKPRTDS
jgi:hypothetical protein